MKTLQLTSVLLIATALAAGCASHPSTATSSAAGAKPYPLTTCVVSGDKLGAMGENYVFAYQGQEVRLCCKDCKKDFDKNPEKYMTQLTGK